jgi:hypothetical protein
VRLLAFVGLAISLWPSLALAADVDWLPGEGAPTNPQLRVVGAIDAYRDGERTWLEGWLVDAFSADRPDRVQIFDGQHLLAEVVSGQFVRRPDVSDRFGSSAYSLSGFVTSFEGAPRVVTVRAHLMSEGWWRTELDLTRLPGARADRVARVACVPNADPFDGQPGVEVEVVSERMFPVRDALVTLTIGSTMSQRSRYGDDGDLHTLIFTLSHEEFALAQGGDPVVVHYLPGSDTWWFGGLDPTVAQDCPS